MKRILRTIIGNHLRNYLRSRGYAIVSYNSQRKKKGFSVFKEVFDETSLLLWEDEGYQLYSLVEKLTRKRKGNLVEIGCFKGGSSKIICEAKGDNPFYVFDTFRGIPSVDKVDINSDFSVEKNQFKANYKEVKKYLDCYPNKFIYKGEFPKENSEILKNKKFIFIHLDVDTYKSTIESLRFFYPKLKKGGIILSHDYQLFDGVRKAFDDFFEDKSETIVELNRSQCMVTK